MVSFPWDGLEYLNQVPGNMNEMDQLGGPGVQLESEMLVTAIWT